MGGSAGAAVFAELGWNAGGAVGLEGLVLLAGRLPGEFLAFFAYLALAFGFGGSTPRLKLILTGFTGKSLFAAASELSEFTGFGTENVNVGVTGGCVDTGSANGALVDFTGDTLAFFA